MRRASSGHRQVACKQRQGNRTEETGRRMALPRYPFAANRGYARRGPIAATLRVYFSPWRKADRRLFLGSRASARAAAMTPIAR